MVVVTAAHLTAAHPTQVQAATIVVPTLATTQAVTEAVPTSPMALPTPMEPRTTIPTIIAVLLRIHTPISATTQLKTKATAHTPATEMEVPAHMAQEATIPMAQDPTITAPQDTMDPAPHTKLSPTTTHTIIAKPSRTTILHTNPPHHTAHMALDIEPPRTRLSLITTHTIIAEPSHTTTLRTETQLAMVPAHTAHPANKIVLSQSNNTRNTSKTPSSSDLMAKAVKVERWVSNAKATVETVLTHGRDKLLAALQSS